MKHKLHGRGEKAWDYVLVSWTSLLVCCEFPGPQRMGWRKKDGGLWGVKRGHLWRSGGNPEDIHLQAITWPTTTVSLHNSASLNDKAEGSRLCPGEPELGLIAPAFPALPSGEGLGYIYIRKLVPASRQTWNLFPFVKLGMAFLWILT